VVLVVGFSLVGQFLVVALVGQFLVVGFSLVE